MVRPVAAGSADLSRLLERAERVASAADRSDLVERLTAARSWLGGRPMRVGVTAGTGAEALVRTLRGVAGRWLPGGSFAEVPGHPGSGRVPPPGSSEVVLFVADAGREYDRTEIDTVSLLHGRATPVLGILASYETSPDLSSVQQANRRLLRAAGLDSPSIPLLPVSAAMCETGWYRGDEGAIVASGIPQLLEYLRDHVDTGVDRRLHDAVRGEVRWAVEQLLPRSNDELARLRAEHQSPQERKKAAVHALEKCQQRSAAWQLALSDGSTEMNAELDFDLRERLREVLGFADDQITTADPFSGWKAFDAELQSKIDTAATANCQVLRDRSEALSREVASQLAGQGDGSFTGVALPKVAIDDPSEDLEKLSSSEEPQGGGSLLSRVVNSVRGSYGGILMVGVLTSLAGEKLISIYSVGAGLLLGLFTFLEDRKNTRERRKSEGKAAVAKRLDEANFRLGDHQRVQLRAVHRTLRNHFTVVNDERLRVAADAVRAAAETRPDDRDQDRISDLQARVDELTDLRDQAGVGAPPARRLTAVGP